MTIARTSDGTDTTQFLYDGDRLVAEYDGSGNLERRYVHGPGVDEPVLWYEGAGLSSPRGLLADHQGSIVAVADAAGNSLGINGYDSWGVPNPNNLGRFQYTGQAWIPELNLCHYKARVYSPGLGRFLQTDPVGYEDQINLYAYVSNDPLNNIDPTGLAEESCTGSRLGAGCDFVKGSEARNALFNSNREEARGMGRARSTGADGAGLAATGAQESSIFDSDGNFRVPVIYDPILGTPVPLTPGYDAEFAAYNFKQAVKGLEAGAAVWGAGRVAKGATTAMGRVLGPKGPVFGNAYYRGAGNSGLLNHGKVRIGWSYNANTGHLNFSLRVGKWHSDKYWNPLSVKPTLQ